MILEVLNHDFHYEIESLCRVFYPNEKIKVVYEPSSLSSTLSEKVVSTTLIDEKDNVNLIASFRDGLINCNGEEHVKKSSIADNKLKNECERQLSVALFKVLKEVTGYIPSWGIQTGVRPSKLMTHLISDYGDDGAKQYFRDSLLVSPAKTQLAFDVAKAETKITKLSSPNSFSLYIAIPFCPTRCSYCSFVSHSIAGENAKRLVPEYVKKLCEEIEIIGEYSKNLDLRLESVYWGGGTPTAISAVEMNSICQTIKSSFDMNFIREYTIEAGRPDTITAEKLEVIKNNNVTRISINPQTFNENVLVNIGRSHTVQKAIEAFKLARSMEFKNINMDLIAGLPGDTIESFCYSLETAIKCNPESITVHTLALKRSSTLVMDHQNVSGSELTSKMLGLVENKLRKNNYFPYYMYRQSRSLGNLENVGWCKDGMECLYNVFIMEECHTVLAAGAGAVTKLKEPKGSHIERIFNFKYPFEYIGRFDELIKRKSRINEFYNS